jgi:hypothetical protein
LALQATVSTARHLFSADLEAFDLRMAAHLALPSRDDAPTCLAFCGIPLDAFDQGQQIVDIDALTTFGSSVFVWASMMYLLCLDGR